MRKFNDAQLKYTVTDQELLAAKEACRHFHPIIYGCEIRIHTDHKNLTEPTTNHQSLPVHRTRIKLDQEYKAKFIHIAGEKNTGGDGLSRLEMHDEVPEAAGEAIYAINSMDRTENDLFLLEMATIQKEQRNDRSLQQLIASGKKAKDLGEMTLDGVKMVKMKGKSGFPRHAKQEF